MNTENVIEKTALVISGVGLVGAFLFGARSTTAAITGTTFADAIGLGGLATGGLVISLVLFFVGGYVLVRLDGESTADG